MPDGETVPAWSPHAGTPGQVHLMYPQRAGTRPSWMVPQRRSCVTWRKCSRVPALGSWSGVVMVGDEGAAPDPRGQDHEG